MEVLPIRVLTDEDIPVFGKLNVSLGQLSRSNFPVARGVCVTAPNLHLKTTLEHYDFSTKEVFEQTLILVKKELKKIPIPEELLKELRNNKKFFCLGSEFKNPRDVWAFLLDFWLTQIKQRIWKDGFYGGITENLEPRIINFVSKVESFGNAFFDTLADDVVINIRGSLREASKKIHPNDQKKILELVELANKKLLITHEYEWIIDRGVKLAGVLPYTPVIEQPIYRTQPFSLASKVRPCEAKCAMKVFVDLSEGLTIEGSGDGTFLDSGKIFNIDKPRDSFDHLVLKLTEIGITYPDKPLFFKLADVREGMGGIRGTLRLLHQSSLREPLIDAVAFAIFKKGLNNIDLVLPFTRSPGELLKLKRELAVKKLTRRNNLKYWLEICVPENIINLEEYLLAGIDGIVLNLDELLSHLTGFDLEKEELGFYKKEFGALIPFLKDPIKLLHKAKLPIIAYGGIALEHEILGFLIEKGVYGIVVKKYDSLSAKDLLYQMEKRVILRKS